MIIIELNDGTKKEYEESEKWTDEVIGIFNRGGCGNIKCSSCPVGVKRSCFSDGFSASYIIKCYRSPFAFKVGDIVGHVLYDGEFELKNCSNDAYTLAFWYRGVLLLSFTKEGKEVFRHDKPSIFLIRRPEKIDTTIAFADGAKVELSLESYEKLRGLE